MTELSAKTAERADIFSGMAEPADAPPLAPHAQGNERVIDREHLSRMTGGDQNLEREVLGIFVVQCDVLLARMRGAPSALAAALAHTLNGSARGIGAWSVTEAAEAVERIATVQGDIAAAVARLSAVTAETRAAIAELSRA